MTRLTQEGDSPSRVTATHSDGALRNLPDLTGRAPARSAVGKHVRELLLPTLTVRRSALDHNLALFAAWCADNGVSHAPHGKTTMAPQLFQAQLDAGAWAITAATVAQARVMWAYGVRRILLANQVVDPPGLSWIAAALADDPDLELLVLVDSVAGVDLMDAHLGDAPMGRPLDVLLELGVSGGRAGARTLEQAEAVASAVGQARHLRLAGVECFEGVYPQDRDDDSVTAVDRFVSSLTECLSHLDAHGHFSDRDEIVLTAGGSGYPDRVAEAFTHVDELSRPVRPVVRSGGYVTHDHGVLGRCSPLDARAGHQLGSLRPALELWAYVLSTPETELAVCGFGKRDAPHDIELPVLLGRVREHGRETLPAAEVSKLNDQHAFLRNADVDVGDLLVFGVTHPCTAFDKWPMVPVLDDSDRVVDVLRTSF